MSKIPFRKKIQNKYPISVNEDFGYYPKFQEEINSRLKRQLAVNVVVTGEAGISKSYTTITLCRVLSKRFTVEDVVSTYAEYMRILLRENRQGVPIMFDEPQYAMDKRDWYNQVNKALIKTITSQRFRLRPLFIPIINLSLLDKILRSFLIQFHVIMENRGEGNVYRLQPSQMEDKLYRTKICSIEYGLYEPKDNCLLGSCLGCEKMDFCEAFRAQYERKKATWMKDRDEAQLEEAETKEIKTTNDALTKLLHEKKPECVNEKGEYDSIKVMGCIKKYTKLKVSRSRAYELIGLTIYEYPDNGSVTSVTT